MIIGNQNCEQLYPQMFIAALEENSVLDEASSEYSLKVVVRYTTKLIISGTEFLLRNETSDF